MSNVLYGTPQDVGRITLDDIPFDSIPQKIQRLALIRQEELLTMLQYAMVPDRNELERELKIITNVLDNINEIVPNRNT